MIILCTLYTLLATYFLYRYAFEKDTYLENYIGSYVLYLISYLFLFAFLYTYDIIWTTIVNHLMAPLLISHVIVYPIFLYKRYTLSKIDKNFKIWDIKFGWTRLLEASNNKTPLEMFPDLPFWEYGDTLKFKVDPFDYLYTIGSRGSEASGLRYFTKALSDGVLLKSGVKIPYYIIDKNPEGLERYNKTVKNADPYDTFSDVLAEMRTLYEKDKDGRN